MSGFMRHIGQGAGIQWFIINASWILALAGGTK
jgi:hypothetical protein